MSKTATKSKQISKGQKLSAPPPDELKSEMLRIARKHFAQHGFQGASLKSIAAEAGVAGSLINYHFHDKQGLFKECIEGFAQQRQASISRVLSDPKNRDELLVRLELFVDEMIVSVMEDPHGFEIIQQEVKAQNPEVIAVFEQTILKGFRAVVQFFVQAQSHGLIHENLDPMILASILFSTTCDASRKEVFSKTFFNVSFSEVEWRNRYTRHVVTLFLNGVIK